MTQQLMTVTSLENVIKIFKVGRVINLVIV